MSLPAFISHHKRAIIWLTTAAMIMMAMITLWWIMVESTAVNPAMPAQPLSTLPIGDSFDPTSSFSSQAISARTTILITVASMIGFAVALIGFNTIMIARANSRDARRKADLQAIAAAFENYYAGYGHYPISSSYDSGYYKGILLNSEWGYYDFPSAEVMKTYMPNWPPSDPQIAADAADQRHNYVYFPQQDGHYFALYASLERPQSESQSYTLSDGLAEEWGEYNFKLTSQQGQPDPVAVPAVEEASINLLSQPAELSEAETDYHPHPAAEIAPSTQPQPAAITIEPATAVVSPPRPTEPTDQTAVESAFVPELAVETALTTDPASGFSHASGEMDIPPLFGEEDPLI